MKTIAITGGIGSGKSVVSKLLNTMGYQVYDCDREAKRLMNTNEFLRVFLSEAFGSETYLPDGSLNKSFLAQQIFGDPDKLKMMNSLVHPAVALDFIGSGCTFIESAILFESGFDKLIHIDQIWCVAAPLELRIQRAMMRDNASREQIIARINSQMGQDEKIKKSNVTIWNDSQHSIIEQVNKLCATLR